MHRPVARTRTLLAALLLGVLPVLLLAAPASAATASDVARALLQDPVYVADDAEASIDAGAVRRQVESGSLPVYVALLPRRAATASGGDARLNAAVGQALGRSAVLVTVAGGTATGGAASGLGFGAGQADAIVDRYVTGGGDLTDELVQAVGALQRASAEAGSSGSGSSGSGSSDGSGTSGGGGGAAVLGVLALVGLGGAGLYLRGNRKRQVSRMAGYRADITSLYDRLGADVSNLDPGDDPVARQALADAAERYNATGALLAQSDTQGEYEAARRTVAEGLAATRLARQRLGLDPGPEVPPPPSEQPQLIRQETVRVGDQELLGSPSYAPGRQYYWGGGTFGGSFVPGGWYGVPFWQSALIGGLVGNALGGGLFGGGYGGGGYDAGYREGVEDAGDLRGGGGGGDWGGAGDWGGGGGGDWGGGGGDGGGASW